MRRSLFRSGPASGGTDPGGGAVRTDLSGAVLSDQLAAGDDHRVGGGAAGRADTGQNPCSVEIAASAALLRRAARLVVRGLAAPCRLRRLGRPRRLARTGQRFFVIADAAAGASRLRTRHVGQGDDYERGRQQGGFTRSAEIVLHIALV